MSINKKIYPNFGELFHGNCLDVLKDIKDDSIDLIVTDPPYKITSRGNSGNTGGMLKSKLSMKGDIFNHNDINVMDYAPEFYRVLKDGTHLYVMCNQINLIPFLNSFTSTGFQFIKSLIWNKGNKIMGRWYMSQFEYILFFRKGTARPINNPGDSDILNVPNIKTKVGGENIHDTEKPIELMNILIKNSSNIGDLILDPFLGSGSTALSCIETNRKFIGMELDDKYFETIQRRIDDKLNINNNEGLF
jgi:site-specific DNA-methyltransferase (adenine-specific)